MTEKVCRATRIAGVGMSMDDGLNENYARLATAIVEQAVKDYDMVLESLYSKSDPLVRIKLFALKAELEAFFHSPWYETLTDLDAKYLMRRTREIATASIKRAIRKRHERQIAAKGGMAI